MTAALKILPRRALLGGLGASAALPFFDLGRLHAQPSSAKRLLIVFNPNGGHDERWTPQGSGTSYELSYQLQPLERHKARLRILAGVDLSSAHDDNWDPIGDRHDRGIGHLLTGVPLVQNSGAKDGIWAGGASLDQYVGNRFGQDTVQNAIVLGVGTRDNGTGLHRLSYRGAADAVPPILDPWVAAEQVFAGVGGDARAKVDQARQNFVLDRASRDLTRLQGQLGGEARCKLEQHVASVEAVRSSLRSGAGLACGKPALGDKQPLTADITEQLAAAHQQILVSALQCNLTRVGVLMYGQAGGGSGDLNLRFSPLNLANQQHELGHKTDDESRRQIDEVHRWEAEQLARLIDNLQATLDDNGAPLIDSTLVWWASDLGNAYGHMAHNVRQVLIGAGVAPGLSRYQGEPHHKLLVSVLRLLGIDDLEHYGSASFGVGPLPGLG